MEAFGSVSSNSNAGVMPQPRRSYRTVNGNGENEVFLGKKYFSGGMGSGRVGEYRSVAGGGECGQCRGGNGEY